MDNDNDRRIPLSDVLTALSKLLWPLIAIAIIVILIDPIKSVIENKPFRIKIGDTEVSVQDLSVQQMDQFSAIQKQIDSIRNKLDSEVDSTTVPVETYRPSGPKFILDELKILWVSDNPQNYLVLEQIIESLGYVITRAKTTNEAMSYLELGNYNYVITDMGRNEGKGFDQVAGLDLLRKSTELYPNVPVLVYSRIADDLKAQISDSGADLVTSDNEQLLARLRLAPNKEN